ncbi:hypothetical protein BU24DRAFT_344227 [Aaosphaeria arxii CBS 175.79]|uniref:Ribosomal protein bL31m N-terminal domain-containing protein n=1 Tax=Aaosphaeria arxii CBS 175.79 TaxID=1450172 RepID=A0A6A5XZT8_9PLEO|nr:uncharacterized protein BU24DRAFT_344227 [Aaosphaeria arxii CBS 175.79]KAF2018433.1 hypothetical protein BU24DRAFT_344227 [Aaosphaeria arxii CBS 175.79]
MATPIPSVSALRILRQSIRSQSSQNLQSTHQVRHATLLRRPKRPYTFTQLITLSDGSTFVHRTTSPAPVYKSTKDIKNTPLWNPSSQKLLNIEEDEAGKLAAFRSKFGRGWDAESSGSAGDKGSDHLLDLISAQKKEKVAKKGSGKKPSAAAASKAKK